MTGLEYFVKEMRHCQLRGLAISAEDILKALEHAMDDAGDRKGHPVPIHWERAADKVADYCRRRAAEEADRRFGQPHFGH